MRARVRPALGEAIAAAHEPQDEVCKGNPDCERNESNLRISTANLQTSFFVGCLWLCWAPETSGQCRSDYDCTPSSPCSAVECDQESCSELEMYDCTRCADANAVVGGCETGQCLDPDRYLSTCGPYIAKGADMDWGMYAEDAVRCRNDVSCDRRSFNGFRRNLSLALIERVSTALERGADGKGTHGKRVTSRTLRIFSRYVGGVDIPGTAPRSFPGIRRRVPAVVSQAPEYDPVPDGNDRTLLTDTLLLADTANPSSPRSWGCSRSTELRLHGPGKGKSGGANARCRAEDCSRCRSPSPDCSLSGYESRPTLTPLR